MSLKQLKLKLLGPIIPVISINNPITTRTYIKTKSKINVDRSVALAVSISCQRGLPVQAQIISQKLVNFANKNNIKLYTFAKDRATGAGYYLLSAGHHVYADRSSLLGNISMSFMKYQLEGLMEKITLQNKSYYTQDKLLQGVLNPFRKLNEDDQKYLKEICEDSHKKIVAEIKKNRGNKIKDADNVFNGEVFTGQQAVQNGMVDQIGTITEILGNRYPGAHLVLQNQKSLFNTVLGL